MPDSEYFQGQVVRMAVLVLVLVQKVRVRMMAAEAKFQNKANWISE